MQMIRVAEVEDLGLDPAIVHMLNDYYDRTYPNGDSPVVLFQEDPPASALPAVDEERGISPPPLIGFILKT